MESRLCRTRLQSLEPYDNVELDYLHLTKFHVDNEYKKEDSDVAARALRQFLHHPFVSGGAEDAADWKANIASYVLDQEEGITTNEQMDEYKKYRVDCRERQMSQLSGNTMSAEDKAAADEEEKVWNTKLDTYARWDANPFLRNGFYQDKAIAKNGGSNATIVVASSHHFCAPLKSHAQAMAVQFCPRPPPLPTRTPANEELFLYIRKFCASPSKDMAAFHAKAQHFLRSGASVRDCQGLHIACANNEFEVAQYLVNLDPRAVDTFDQMGNTSLMVSAVNAAGRSTKYGISETRVMDLLLARGADKSLQDRKGMTAYGHFVALRAEYQTMMQAMTGHAVSAQADHPTEAAIKAKLLPPGGPTASDLNGGAEEGIVDYSREDREHGLEDDMGDY